MILFEKRPQKRGIASESGLQLAFREYFHPRIRRSSVYPHRLDNHVKQHVASQNQASVRLEDLVFTKCSIESLTHRLPEHTAVLIEIGSDALMRDQYTPGISLDTGCLGVMAIVAVAMAWHEGTYPSSIDMGVAMSHFAVKGI